MSQMVQSKKKITTDTSTSEDSLLAIARDNELIRAAFFSMSKHPELMPLASILARYTGVRAMNACLGPGLSQRCRHCMEYLGVNLHDTGLNELCECCFSLVCRYTMAHPLQSIRLAQQSVDYITKAIETLATLPETFQAKHKAFAKLLWHNHESTKQHPEGACPIHSLQKGMELYNEKGKNWGDWLHVGLPEILSELQKTNTIQNEKALETYISEQYAKWKQFGKIQLSAIQQNKS